MDAETLEAEQARDPTLRTLDNHLKEGVSKRNVTWQRRSGLLYRQYRDSKGVHFDQLVVPSKYRDELLSLTHGSGWSCHLGIKKTNDCRSLAAPSFQHFRTSECDVDRGLIIRLGVYVR